MSQVKNTLFLRLAGPMQSWGTTSRFQLRRTDIYPSKSGVLGMLLCAKGIRREDSETELKRLNRLLMGVRVDRKGTLDWDYNTAGAKIGIRQAKDRKPKITQSTGEYETLISRRQYLYDASFLVSLQGDVETIGDLAQALDEPVWPLFLGRKCCVPAEPVFAGTENFNTLTDALSSFPWRPKINDIDHNDSGSSRMLDIYIELPPGPKMPEDARIVYDVPQKFAFFSYGPRWVIKKQVSVVGEEIQVSQPYASRGDPYSEHFKKIAKPSRLKLDDYLCVFCKSPAQEMHHVSYENAEHETDADLRSLCKICHDTCTMLEYGHDMRARRVDPSDPAQRQMILDQRERLLKERRLARRRELLRTARKGDYKCSFLV